MAIPDTLAVRLMNVVGDHELGGDFLMLGRQRWVGSRRKRSARLFQDTIKARFPDLSEEDFASPDNKYSETFFERLGFDQVDSMDVSDFEDASIVQDLAGKLPKKLRGRFDVIYDGGTCEHVFDLPTAYRNIDRMLKPGGVLIGHSPCNNWINHGFYQITPEMVYGFWEKTLGYEVLECELQPLLPMFAHRSVGTTNPNETGVRPRLLGKLPDGPVILSYAVRKPLQKRADKGTKVYQTDYQARWSEGEEQQTVAV
ncbi:methyltransferase domain-containing protein [Shimia sp. R9_1]|uniref:class I SAM-dependent methyltransferase n=1 Tax=Shimia sp. R9_1 TaxID=2821111 RepID=UPI001ADA9265|nr:class I SAM-dependent methyltransferase [Shimia sp. R9_1]MBO9407705.1 methyltransferase domain-containing protein [Shimia sp. R9_1]